MSKPAKMLYKNFTNQKFQLPHIVIPLLQHFFYTKACAYIHISQQKKKRKKGGSQATLGINRRKGASHTRKNSR